MINQRIIVFKNPNIKSQRSKGINVKKTKSVSVNKKNKHFFYDKVITLKSPNDINIPKIMSEIEQQHPIVKKRV